MSGLNYLPARSSSEGYPPNPQERDAFFETDTDLTHTYLGGQWVVLSNVLTIEKTVEETKKKTVDEAIEETKKAFNSQVYNMPPGPAAVPSKAWQDAVKEILGKVPVSNWKRPVFADGPGVIDRNHYPHDCPSCNKPAYVGATDIDCSSSGCEYFRS